MNTVDSLMQQQAWSGSATANEIFFVTYQSTLPVGAGDKMSTLWVVSAAGGTPVALYSEVGSFFGTLSASSDGSKVALRVQPFTGAGSEIRIIDRNTPLVGQRSVVNGTHAGIGYLEWSRTGADHVAYAGYTTLDGTASIYHIDLTQTTPVPVLVGGGSNPTWSPDNSKILYDGYSSATNYLATLATGVVATHSTTAGSQMNWRQ
jgi:hypothetical protein